MTPIEAKELRSLQGNGIYFRWKEGCRCQGCPADDFDRNLTILKYKIASGDDVIILYDADSDLLCGSLMLYDYGKRWFFVLVDEAGVVTNKGRDKCWKCRCTTEKRRDFNTFEVRDMCPRCKI